MNNQVINFCGIMTAVVVTVMGLFTLLLANVITKAPSEHERIEVYTCMNIYYLTGSKLTSESGFEFDTGQRNVAIELLGELTAEDARACSNYELNQ